MKLSILVPLRPERGRVGKTRIANWRWLEQRWRAHFPEAEVVLGTDDGESPFSKTMAVNDAFSRSSGDMLVIADADSWVEAPQLVKGLHYAEQMGVLVVPWTSAFRLSHADTTLLRASEPSAPNPVTAKMKKAADDYKPSPSTAAMVVIISREGFGRVGGMDHRFRGWGAEDVAFGLACGTLLGRSHILPGDGFALWHDRPRKDGLRIWQDDPGHHNVALGDRYWKARGQASVMEVLCAEHALPGFVVERSPNAGRRPLDQLVPVLEPSTGPEVLVREFVGGGLREGDTIAL